ncbi:unnamed protein product [Urochloa decumbens]|uniref:Uncharacterized protein n=1 Tax=Urochloa decumbens TaxID=240449 RepID=A0ABC8WFC9_9POAL
MELRAGEEEDLARGLGKERAWKGATVGAAAIVPARGDDGKGGASSSSSPSFARRCVGLVKEQRARLYIARRCVTMLACWRDTDTS